MTKLPSITIPQGLLRDIEKAAEHLPRASTVVADAQRAAAAHIQLSRQAEHLRTLMDKIPPQFADLIRGWPVD